MIDHNELWDVQIDIRPIIVFSLGSTYDCCMDISHIKRPEDWDFEIPAITAEAINDLLDALARDERWVGSLYDELDGATREMSNIDEETLVRDYYLLEQWDKNE